MKLNIIVASPPPQFPLTHEKNETKEIFFLGGGTIGRQNNFFRYWIFGYQINWLNHLQICKNISTFYLDCLKGDINCPNLYRE